MDLKFFKLDSPENEGMNFAPLFSDGVSAGFPSPAEADCEGPLNLNSFMVIHPEATFYARVDGDSMIDAGIFDGDYLVVDRALDARENDVVVASVNGEFCVKVLNLNHNPPMLLPQNKNYSPIIITPDVDFVLFGVVTGVVRKLRHRSG
jgi:DNA polymerase V